MRVSPLDVGCPRVSKITGLQSTGNSSFAATAAGRKSITTGGASRGPARDPDGPYVKAAVGKFRRGTTRLLPGPGRLLNQDLMLSKSAQGLNSEPLQRLALLGDLPLLMVLSVS